MMKLRDKERGERMRRLVVIKMVLVICLMASLPLIKVEAKSSIYGELLGNGVLYSLNYEHFIKDELPIRVGFERINQENSGFTFGSENTTMVVGGYTTLIPVSISKLYGEDRHKFELGGGILYTRLYIEGSIYGNYGGKNSETIEARNDFDLIGVCGYRYQPPSRGFLFRFTYTPLIANKKSNNETLLFWLGLSLGYTF